MEDRFVEEDVRHRLILSGISELEEHGISGFSLRRAAMGAQVSCAAPYRHFKDKEEYINEIISYVGSKWELLSREIEAIFDSELRTLVIEICIASLRFRIANRHLPLALAHTGDAGGSIDGSIRNAVRKYCEAQGIMGERQEIYLFETLCLLHGALSMVNEENSEKILELTKRALMDKFN